MPPSKLRKKGKNRDLNQEFLEKAEVTSKKISNLIIKIIETSFANSDSLIWDLEKAVKIGLLASISNLLKSTAYNSKRCDGETVRILLRCVMERAINLIIIIDQPTEIKRYIIHSFVSEKEYLDELAKIADTPNAKRGLQIMQIEFAKEMVMLNLKPEDIKPNGWNKTHKRREIVFGKNKMMNHFVTKRNHEIHGNWNSISNDFLNIGESEFSVNLKGPMPRTSEIIGMSTICLSALKKFIKNSTEITNKEFFDVRIKKIQAEILENISDHHGKIKRNQKRFFEKFEKSLNNTIKK